MYIDRLTMHIQVTTASQNTEFSENYLYNSSCERPATYNFDFK